MSVAFPPDQPKKSTSHIRQPTAYSKQLEVFCLFFSHGLNSIFAMCTRWQGGFIVLRHRNDVLPVLETLPRTAGVSAVRWSPSDML